jgi:hypothetical protein
VRAGPFRRPTGTVDLPAAGEVARTSAVVAPFINLRQAE